MSSVLGSIEDNDKGGIYPYRTSKAALNMLTKSMSLDLKKHNIKAISIHPGWVKTDMGGPNAPLDKNTSIEGVLNVIEKVNDDVNGKMIDYQGKIVPW